MYDFPKHVSDAHRYLRVTVQRSACDKQTDGVD